MPKTHLLLGLRLPPFRFISGLDGYSLVGFCITRVLVRSGLVALYVQQSSSNIGGAFSFALASQNSVGRSRLFTRTRVFCLVLLAFCGAVLLYLGLGFVPWVGLLSDWVVLSSLVNTPKLLCFVALSCIGVQNSTS